MKVAGWLPIQSPVKALGTLINLLLSAWKSLAGYPYEALWRLWGHSSTCCCLHESPWLATHTKPCEGFGDTHQIAAVCMKVPGWIHIQSPVKGLGTLINLLLSAWKSLAAYPYKALWRLLEDSSYCCCLHEKSLAGYPYKALWRLWGHSSNWCCLHESPWQATHTKPCEGFGDTHQIGAVCMKVTDRLHIQSPVKTLRTLIKLVLSAWKYLAGYLYKALWRLWGHSSNCCCLHESPWLATHTKPSEDFWDTHKIGAVCMKVPGWLPIQSPLKTFGTLIKLVLSAWKSLAGYPYKALWRLLEH